jgi:hypothetical protein
MTNGERLRQVCRVCSLDYEAYAPAFTGLDYGLRMQGSRTLRDFVYYRMGRYVVPLGVHFWESVARDMDAHDGTGIGDEAALGRAYRRALVCLI